jgi:uncharacterized protein
MSESPESWTHHLLVEPSAIHSALRAIRSIAVVGIKPASSGAPAFYVPEYAQSAGYRVIPVPTYYPELTTLLGEPVYRSLAAIPEPVDMVQLFRRSDDVAAHLDDILAVNPKLVWMQLGIRHDATAEALAKAGIQVVQDRCLLIELRAMGR